MGGVTVVGSFAVGLTLRADRFPVSGETILARDFDLGPGGKGSNQAVQVARLGGDVEFVSLIGTDDFASIAKDLYRREGVGTTFLRSTTDRNTGVGFIILDAAGDNRIVLDPGANELFSPSHVAKAASRIASSSVVLTQLEIPAETALAATRAAKEQGAIAILNPAPARPLDQSAFADIDLLTPNQGEARILLGLEPNDPIDDLEVCGRLLDLGAGKVILTQGDKGALIFGPDGTTHVDAFSVDVVDTTGAGDAFNGTMAAALASGLSLEEAVERAAAGGALACTALGVIPSLPYAKDVEALVESRR